MSRSISFLGGEMQTLWETLTPLCSPLMGGQRGCAIQPVIMDTFGELGRWPTWWPGLVLFLPEQLAGSHTT